MLSGFECDDDQTSWLAGLALWATGASAGCLLAVASAEPALLHWQVLALAVLVSLVSLGLRLPVMLARCVARTWLVHALWMLAFFAQINWAGFLAARSSTGTIAAEAMLICVGFEFWLLVVFVAQGQLPWLQKLIGGKAVEPVVRDSAEASPLNVTVQAETETEEIGDVRREFVDGIDENGQRYLSGSVRVQFAAQQRTEGFVLSFCPALDGALNVELECDSEDVTVKVEHATETGARISLRRQSINEAASVTVDWFATASEDSPSKQSLNLP